MANISYHHANVPIFFRPLKTHFYIVKLEFAGVHVYIIFLISALKHTMCQPGERGNLDDPLLLQCAGVTVWKL